MAFSSKKIDSKTKWHLSENLAFQNLLKKYKLLPTETFWNILALGKESKRKLLTLTSADSFIKNDNVYDFRVEISIMPKWKIFWFQKNPIHILWIFNCYGYILVGLWVKVFISQGWVQAEITVHAL